MKKIIIYISFSLLLASCTTITLSKYNKYQIMNTAIEFVDKKYGEKLGIEDISFYKKGYGVWYVTLYGYKANYEININEDNNIIEDKKIEFELIE